MTSGPLAIADLFLPMRRCADSSALNIIRRVLDGEPARTINEPLLTTQAWPVKGEEPRPSQDEIFDPKLGLSASPLAGELLMVSSNARKLRKLVLYTSLIAVVGLGSSILCGNEDGFVAHVSVFQQKVLLVFASAIAVRVLCTRISVSEEGANKAIRAPFYQPDSPDKPAEANEATGTEVARMKPDMRKHEDRDAVEPITNGRPAEEARGD